MLYVIKYILFLFACFSILALRSASSSFAQDVSFKGNTYYQPNIQSISKFYWRMGLPDIDNKVYIDDFIGINECEIYRTYSANEFEWEPIRTAMTEYILANKERFPNKFYLDVPVEISTYDQDNNYFIVANKGLSFSVKEFSLDVTTFITAAPSCSFLRKSSSYPTDLIFKLVRPLSLPYIKVREDIAQELVLEWQKKAELPRILGMRLYITPLEFVEKKEMSAATDGTLFYTIVNGFQIFAPADMNTPLYTRHYKTKEAH